MTFEYLEETKSQRVHDDSLLSISACGGCLLKIFLEKKGIFKEEYDPSKKRIFRAGDSFHNLIITEIMEKAYDSGIRIVAAECDIVFKERNIKGRVDAIISDGVELSVLDIKSCSNYAFEEYKKGKIPPAYIIQIQLYLKILGYKKGILLFVNKNNQKTFEHTIIYDETFVNDFLNKLDKFYKDMENNIPPETCTSKYPCAACNYFSKNRDMILNKLIENKK